AVGLREAKAIDVALLFDQAPPPPPPPRPAGSRRVAAYAVGAFGLSVAGVASYFGIRALVNEHKSNSICPHAACGDNEALHLNSDAKLSADLATGGFVVAGAALGASAVLWFWPAPPSTTRAVRVFPSFGTRGAAGFVEARW